MLIKYNKACISIVAIILVAGIGSLCVGLGIKWFNSLVFPSQFLPNFVIPIVWTIIYLSTGIILFLWIKDEGKLPKDTTILLIINGILNMLWCLVFFTLKQLFLGQVIILINAYMGVYLNRNISKYKKLYSLILIIYPIWLIIASSLNICLWVLN